MTEEMTIHRGALDAWWDQGMEGRIEYALAVKGIPHPIFIEEGNELIIFNEDGSVLWSGSIQFVPLRWWDKHKLNAGIYAWHKQKGVSYAQWMEWFWRKPALNAELHIKGTPTNRQK